MTTEELQSTRKLADEITDFVKKGSEEPIYTVTVIDEFTKNNESRSTVKMVLWDLIVGNRIRVGDRFELSIPENVIG